MRHTLRNINRLNKIIRTLVRHGFGGLVADLRIIPFFGTLEKAFIWGKRGVGKSDPERIRLVLEELGPTFIKLGQIASTRADLLPPEWVAELKKLQDSVPPFPFEAAKKTIEQSLKAQLSTVFSSFEEIPVASASIAQVHLATLHNGDRVAVKVKRPNIERTIESDLSVMHTIADLLIKYVPASKRYRPREVVNEFERVIDNELNLSLEGVNLNRFGNLFKDDPTVQIPKVYWKYTTEDILTMECVTGTPIDEPEKIKSKGLDIRQIATNGVELFFRQVFEFGIFHADLHPGNIFVRDDGAIIYLDFGIVGRLDRDLRKYLANMLYCLVKQDYYKMAVLHREMGLIAPEVSIHEFEEALRDISEPMFGRSLDEINISVLLMKLIQTARKFNMILQPNLLLLQKSMVIIEGVGRQLYPDINMWEVAKPLITKWMIREKLSPRSIYDKSKESATEYANAALELPLQAHDLLDKALTERLRIGFVHHRLEPLTDEIYDTGKRIGAGVLAGALFVSASIIAAFARPDATTFLGLPILSWVGYAMGGIIAIRSVFHYDHEE